jgi:hypothetical protein
LFNKIVVEMHFHIEDSLIRLRKILKRLERKGFNITLEHPLPKGDKWMNFRKKQMTFLASKS